VLNTCVVRESAENKAVNKLHKVKVMKRNKPDMTIGLMGCMVGMREQTRLAKKFPWVDVFMPPSDPAPLMEYIQEHELHDLGEVVATQEKAVLNAIQDGEHILPALQRGNRVVAHVPIVLGCSHAPSASSPTAAAPNARARRRRSCARSPCWPAKAFAK